MKRYYILHYFDPANVGSFLLVSLLGLILYFLTLTVGRFLYFDFTVKSFLETIRGVLENLPLLVIMSAYSGFVCWYGFHVGFLLKSNGVILSTFLAHLFMDCSIFLLHKTGILKHVIRKI